MMLIDQQTALLKHPLTYVELTEAQHVHTQRRYNDMFCTYLTTFNTK